MKHDPHQKRESERYENPIASREFILECMASIGEPAAFKRIAKALNIEEPVGRDALKLRLRAMVRDGQLIADERNVYAIATRLALIAGRISAHRDGYGFLICDEERDDIFLSHRHMRAVFHGDRVLVRVRGRDRRGRDEGEIVEVLEHNTMQLVGRVYFENNVALLDALNRRIDHKILVTGDPDQLVSGQIAVARVVEQPTLHGLPAVEIVDILGEHLTPELEVEVALRNNEIPYEFPDEVIAEVDGLPYEVSPTHKANRNDLRHLEFVTIDGEDARDFDDAVYCEPRPQGGWRLYVAVADVANYVREPSALDVEGRQRGTSVYFPQYVVPMLPEKLSNGLCSLNPEVDRLVMVCEMTISAQGKIGSYKFYEGVIHSKGRLTYTQVAAWIDEGAFPRHADSLHALLDLHHILHREREKRGALDFDTTEVTFSFDTTGRVSDVQPVVRNIAHKIIEECMLCANVSAARLIAGSGKPGLYRVHDKPDAEKVTYLREFLAGYGCELGGGEMPTPIDYQFAANQLRSLKNGNVLQLSLLRSLQQAVYQPENKGHFGLAYTHYAHFTSPIRRYPDLLVHRLIKSLIHSEQEYKSVERFGKRRKKEQYEYSLEQMIAMGEHLSMTERRADEAVYEVLEWVKCDYISDHVGDIFDGVVSGVTKFGLFVQLTDLYVEGLVHVSTLVGDYYQYDQSNQLLTGERSSTTFGMGDVVSVQVAGVDVDERKIDFELVSHSPIKRQKLAKNSRSKNSRSKKTGNKEMAGKETKASSNKAKAPAKKTKKTKVKRVSDNKAQTSGRSQKPRKA